MCEYLRCEVVYGACRRFFWSINYTLTHHPVTIVDIGDTSGVMMIMANDSTKTNFSRNDIFAEQTDTDNAEYGPNTHRPR